MESVRSVVYISHLFSSDPVASLTSIRRHCRRLVEEGFVPLAPQLLFPQFLDESTERDLAIACCLRLVGVCSELRVFGHKSDGVKREIAEAKRLGIPVVYRTNEGARK